MNKQKCSLLRCLVFVTGISGACVPYIQSGVLGSFAKNVAFSMSYGIKKIVPTRPFAVAVLCIAGGMTVKALWSRCIKLRKINEKINPNVLLNVDRRERSIYNWMMGAPGFTTAAQIRLNNLQVKQALTCACLSGEVDVFQYGTGIRLQAGHRIYWADVMSSLDTEIARIQHWMRELEPFVDISFKGVHLFGIRKNFAQACADLEYTGLDQLRHVLTGCQEAAIEAVMTENRGLGERVIAFLMANPNYDQAHRLFWDLDQRLGRLYAMKDAVVQTPVNWSLPLH